jgi:hypothetical protein
VSVRQFEIRSCPTNPDAGTRPRIRLHGLFFNAGVPMPGDFSGEVVAAVRAQRRADSVDAPGVFRVQGTVFRCEDFDCNVTTDLPTVLLGFLAVGASGTISVQWDPDNDRFVFGFGATTIATGYPWADGTPPANPLKRLELSTVVSNCTSLPRPMAAIDATFDDVFVNASAAALLRPSVQRSLRPSLVETK